MSNTLKRIADDIDDYLHLCKHFGEEPKYTLGSRGCWIEDCYGEHEDSLRKRMELELANESS